MAPAVSLLGKGRGERGQVSGRGRPEGQGYLNVLQDQEKESVEWEWGKYCQLPTQNPYPFFFPWGGLLPPGRGGVGGIPLPLSSDWLRMSM